MPRILTWQRDWQTHCVDPDHSYLGCQGRGKITLLRLRNLPFGHSSLCQSCASHSLGLRVPHGVRLGLA